MTGQELYDFTTQLLAGRAMDATPFFIMLNLAKNIRELKRPWMVLRTEDSSQSFSSSTSIDVTKDLPADFLRPLERKPLVLVSSSGSVLDNYKTIKYPDRHAKADESGFVFFNYKTRKFGITGSLSQTYTAYLQYIAKGATITAGSSWDNFDSAFHPILAADVAVMQKGSVDYDDINSRMVQYHGMTISDIERAMNMWDDSLQRSELGGR